MSVPVILSLLWLILANVIAMFPSRDHHWRSAFALIAIGIPLVGWVTWVNGPLLGLVFLAGGISVLRWPVIYLWRWVRAQGAGRAE